MSNRLLRYLKKETPEERRERISQTLQEVIDLVEYAEEQSDRDRASRAGRWIQRYDRGMDEIIALVRDRLGRQHELYSRILEVYANVVADIDREQSGISPPPAIDPSA